MQGQTYFPVREKTGKKSNPEKRKKTGKNEKFFFYENGKKREKLKNLKKNNVTKSTRNEGLRRLAGSNGSSSLVSYTKLKMTFKKSVWKTWFCFVLKVIFH